jgi:hypothetical protein
LHSIPQTLVRLDAFLLAMLLVHTPKAKAIHNLPQRVVLVVELDAAHDVEDDVRAGAHVERVDRAGRFGDVVACFADPVVPARPMSAGDQ